jgi:hypothetical protein
MEITTILELFGFQMLDLFVLQQTTVPIMREKYRGTVVLGLIAAPERLRVRASEPAPDDLL